MATVTDRLERIVHLLTEPAGGWHHTPLLEQTRTARREAEQLYWALNAASEQKEAGNE